MKIFQKFLRSEQIGGIVLIFCVLISLLIANSALGVPFERLLKFEFGIRTSSFNLKYPISLWINDG